MRIDLPEFTLNVIQEIANKEQSHEKNRLEHIKKQILLSAECEFRRFMWGLNR